MIKIIKALSLNKFYFLFFTFIFIYLCCKFIKFSLFLFFCFFIEKSFFSHVISYFLSVIMFIHENSFSTGNSILIVIFTPLFLGCVLYFFSGRVNLIYLFLCNFLMYLLSVLYCFSVFYKILFFKSQAFVKIFDFFSYSDLNISFSLCFDSKIISMVFIVNTVSFLVSLFSLWYMYNDPNYIKFLSFLSFFTFFMLLLVSANDLVLLFVGWEGIGLLSYLLINFWSTRLLANRSALKAIVVNKIGDCSLYAFIFSYFFLFETMNISGVKHLSLFFMETDSIFFNLKFVTFMAVLLLVAAVAKSAQLFLHVWLPDAMEGPTPVSALLHAATMVTAGIYTLLKFDWLFLNNYALLNAVVIIGLFTNLLASFVAIFQYDIKKIIAYSTASQIGIIFTAFGILKFNLAFFHIFNHAFFKALLFILAGILIHFFANNQDLRAMINCKKNLFFVYVSFLLASLTLVGLPFLSAYYSKEFIIQNSFFNEIINADVAYYFLNLSVVTTLIYSFKILNYIYFGHSNLIMKNHRVVFHKTWTVRDIVPFCFCVGYPYIIWGNVKIIIILVWQQILDRFSYYFTKSGEDLNVVDVSRYYQAIILWQPFFEHRRFKYYRMNSIMLRDNDASFLNVKDAIEDLFSKIPTESEKDLSCLEYEHEDDIFVFITSEGQGLYPLDYVLTEDTSTTPDGSVIAEGYEYFEEELNLYDLLESASCAQTYGVLYFNDTGTQKQVTFYMGDPVFSYRSINTKFFEEEISIKIVCFILVVFSIFIGYIFSLVYLNESFIFSNEFEVNIYLEKTNVITFLENSSFIIFWLMALVFFIIYLFTNNISFVFYDFTWLRNFYNISSRKFFFDNIYFYLSKDILSTNYIYALILDKELIESLIIFNVNNLIRNFRAYLKLMSSSFVFIFLCVIYLMLNIFLFCIAPLFMLFIYIISIFVFKITMDLDFIYNYYFKKGGGKK